MDAGALIDLEITDVAHGGVFVGRYEGRVVFVPDAIPGETVRVRLTEPPSGSAADTRRFLRGEALEILDASPHRRPHVWRDADIGTPPGLRPGGADFGHIELSHQRALKAKVVADALQRMGGIDLPVEVQPARPLGSAADYAAETTDGTAWRTRLSLHIDDEGRIGPYAARSHRVIPVTEHPLATPAIERAALQLAGGRPGRVDLVEPSDGRVRVIPRPDARHRPRRGDRHQRPGPAETGPAREVILERVGDRSFRVDAGGFWQVHRLAAQSLSALVTTALAHAPGGDGGIDPDAWHLDLYGGVGLFAAALGDLGGPATRVTSVESDQRATDHAGENLAGWVGARAVTARVDRWLAALSAEASAVERERLSRGAIVLDPPRSGAGREVVEAVAGLRPQTVVYVACDPVALARDLASFRTSGYETTRIDAVDLFPNSHHIEAIAALTRTAPHR